MSAGNRRTQRPDVSIDAVLLGAILALATVGGLLLCLSPQWWGSYLALLDVRFWTPWKIVVLGIALMQVLLVVRHWPQRE